MIPSGKGSSSSHARTLPGVQVEPGPVPEHPPPEATVSGGIKPHSSTVSLDPLVSGSVRLEASNAPTLRLDPHNSSFPSVSGGLNPPEPGGADPGPGTNREALPYTFASSRDASVGQVSGSLDTRVKEAPVQENGGQVVVPLPDPPPNSCLKSGALANHRDPRSGSRAGLRVHFKLPEDEEEDERSDASEDTAQTWAKEPPPVRAKPKL